MCKHDINPLRTSVDISARRSYFEHRLATNDSITKARDQCVVYIFYYLRNRCIVQLHLLKVFYISQNPRARRVRTMRRATKLVSLKPFVGTTRVHLLRLKFFRYFSLRITESSSLIVSQRSLCAFPITGIEEIQNG